MDSQMIIWLMEEINRKCKKEMGYNVFARYKYLYLSKK